MVDGGTTRLTRALPWAWEQLSYPEQMAISFQYAKWEQVNKLLSEIPMNRDAVIRVHRELVNNRDAYNNAMYHLGQLEKAGNDANGA